MKFTAVYLAAVSATMGAASVLPPPDNFPACGTTCFNAMLHEAGNLGCGTAGTTENAVDGACLCKNINFTYGIIDCSNAACHDGDAKKVIQYGIDWCAANGVVVGGINATPDPSYAASASTTIFATDAGSASTAVSSTMTNSSGSTVTTSDDTATETGSVIPIATSDVVSTMTDSSGSVMIMTLATSTIFSTISASETASVTDTASATESTAEPTDNDSTDDTSATDTASASSMEGAPATSTQGGAGARQTMAPFGLLAAAGLAVLAM